MAGARAVARRALADPRVVGSGLALALLVLLALRLRLLLNHDIAWYLHSANAFLDGGRLYQDIFFEVNPPLMLFLTVPPVALARLGGFFAPDLFIAYVFALAALSMVLIGRLLGSLPGLSPSARHGLIGVALLTLLVLPASDFGQREHLMVVLSLPYMLLIARRAAGPGCGRTLALAIGVLAGLGFALKPHFLLVPVLLEVYLLARRRRIGACVRAETIALGASLALYLLTIFVFTPDYLTRVVPFALEVYNDAYRNPLLAVLYQQETLLLPLLGFLWLSLRRALDCAALADVLMIGALGFFVAYLVQMKGWNYHVYPTAALLLMTAGVLLLASVRP